LKNFQQTKNLPTLPNGVKHLLDTLFDKDIDFIRLSSIIAIHPNITVRLISIANSAWSAPVTPITNIEDACSRLGITVVRNVSIALSISAPFNASNCPLFDIEHYWTSCMLVSDAASMLSTALPKKHFNSEFQNTVQTAGIIHSIGLLWLADNMALETGQALQAIINDPSISLNQALKTYTNTDYCEVGYILAQHWDIPEILITAIKYHQKNYYKEQFWEITHLIGSAAIMAKAVITGDENLPSISYLDKLNIEKSFQEDVFKKLEVKLDKTRELAKALFN